MIMLEKQGKMEKDIADMKSLSNNHAEHPLSTTITQLEQEKEDLLSQNRELTC